MRRRVWMMGWLPIISLMGTRRMRVAMGIMVLNMVYVAGKFGQAAQFNGVSTYIQVAHNDNLNLQHLTLVAWVYDYHHSGTSLILLKGNWSSGGPQKRQYEFSSTYGEQEIVNFGLLNAHNMDWEWIKSTSNIAIEQWKHIVATYDGKIQKLYIDGSLDSARTVSFEAFIPHAPEPLTIGAGFTDDQWVGIKNGLIDDLRLYNRALSECEIQSLYEGTEKCGGFTLHKQTLMPPTSKVLKMVPQPVRSLALANRQSCHQT